MASDRETILSEAWLGGRGGTLSGKEVARAWALRQVWRDDGKTEHGMWAYIASKVWKVGGGHPQGEAVKKLLVKIDNDPTWYPGKNSDTTPGPKSPISGTNQALIAQSAMAMKERGTEPTYPLIIAANPRAALNPDTNKPVGKKRIYSIMQEFCYDEDPEDTWSHRARLSRQALPDDVKAKRATFADHVQKLNHQGAWFFRRVVWTDLCNSVLPRSEKKATEQALARKGKKGWGSEGTKEYSGNLRGKKEALKQNSWDAVRVWWLPILTQGKLHLETVGTDFPGETQEGASVLVSKVRSALNLRFRSDQPTTLFVDRGKGFYNPGTGKITDKFKDALRENELKTFFGDDASAQPGNLGDVLLHETAVSWVRYRLERTLPRTPWTETVEEFSARLKEVAADINNKLNVEGLCWKFPGRVQELIDREGDRLSK